MNFLLRYQGARVAYARYGAPLLTSPRNLAILGGLAALLILLATGTLPHFDAGTGFALGIGILAPYTAEQVRGLDLDAIKLRATEVTGELDTLEAKPEAEWTEEDTARHAGFVGEVALLEARGKTIVERSAVKARAASIGSLEPVAGPTIRSKPSVKDVWDLNTLRYGTRRDAEELRGRAMTAIETLDWVDDDKRNALAKALKKGAVKRDSRGAVAGLTLVTMSPEYVSAFHKGLAGRMDLWTNEERQAVAATEEFRAAMSLTDANGGYAIPTVLDPQIILTNTGTVNPVREYARVIPVAGDNWNGLTSSGVDASYDAEAAEVSDDSPTFGAPNIVTRMARAFVRGSVEISEDFSGLADELGVMFADAKDRLNSTKYWSGSAGSNEPIGIETALAGGASIITPTTTEVFAVADIYKLAGALPARHRGKRGARKAAFMAEYSTINAIRQFATANNYHAFLVDASADSPALLLGYPLEEWSAMDAYSAVDTAATATNHILAFGDWSKYVIIDRIGGTIEFIPHLFHTSNNLPSFQRGWVYYWRDGADSIDDNAFRILNLATTA